MCFSDSATPTTISEQCDTATTQNSSHARQKRKYTATPRTTQKSFHESERNGQVLQTEEYKKSERTQKKVHWSATCTRTTCKSPAAWGFGALLGCQQFRLSFLPMDVPLVMIG